MPSEEKSDMHHQAPESDVPKPCEGPGTGEKSLPKAEAPKDERHQETDAGLLTNSSHAPPAEDKPADDPDSDSAPPSDWDFDCTDLRGESPGPISDPCTCHCGGCCCHGSSTEARHCVRCHANYTFNHSQACSVPHVFDREPFDSDPHDVALRSTCCGMNVTSGEPIKQDWSQPYPCFLGWHTTDIEATKEQYNGMNVLRCNPGRDGKCRRGVMKYHAHYRNIFEDIVKYTKLDGEDRKAYLKRKREEMGNEFQHVYGNVSEEVELKRKRPYY